MSLGGLDTTLLTYERPATGTDGSGGKVITETITVQNVSAAICPAKDAVMTLFHRRQMQVDYSILTDADLDNLVPGGPRVNDRWVDAAGNRYLIQGVQKALPSAIWPVSVYRFDCQLLKPAN